MLTETITWVPVGHRLPDCDLTVHVAPIGGDEPVWLGYLDGDQWRAIDGDPIEVSHWADMPHGPSPTQPGRNGCPPIVVTAERAARFLRNPTVRTVLELASRGGLDRELLMTEVMNEDERAHFERLLGVAAPQGDSWSLIQAEAAS